MKLPADHWLTRARRTTLQEELDELDLRAIRIILAIVATGVSVYYLLRDRVDLDAHALLTLLLSKF